ncbi:unnamed protein product [Phytomonas sp. Hart1]|nr:unnamed protein product [Phytomonas sp. Hart1]|eukprot:CCW71900.1 unnamed protein product [Phytomonas sp. isolate Hart1]
MFFQALLRGEDLNENRIFNDYSFYSHLKSKVFSCWLDCSMWYTFYLLSISLKLLLFFFVQLPCIFHLLPLFMFSHFKLRKIVHRIE